MSVRSRKQQPKDDCTEVQGERNRYVVVKSPHLWWLPTTSASTGSWVPPMESTIPRPTGLGMTIQFCHGGWASELTVF